MALCGKIELLATANFPALPSTSCDHKAQHLRNGNLVKKAASTETMR